MREHEVGFVPVVADNESMALVGVITDRDIAVRHVAEGHAGDCAVASHMTSDDIETVKDTADPESVLAAMRRREVRRREGDLRACASALIRHARRQRSERIGSSRAARRAGG